MSNTAAVAECIDVIRALDECKQQSWMAKLGGVCFDLEKQVRICRHEARKQDRREHVAAARERDRKIENKRRERMGMPSLEQEQEQKRATMAAAAAASAGNAGEAASSKE